VNTGRSEHHAFAVVAALFGVFWATSAQAADCHPEVEPSKPQYIVGYGSLMSSSSKRITEPDAGVNVPVLVTGFERAWNTHGSYGGTTFLGIRPSQSATIAAALYRDFLEEGKLGADARERSYCRAAVDPASIRMLDGSAVPAPSQIWIYVNKSAKPEPPNAEHPITQSYVDLFISGCIELQSRVAVPDLDFVERCIRTTRGWSKHWVNDRLYPRRPLAHEPMAWKIDQYLRRLLPKLFAGIRIE
jgi:hypothetical protein